MLDFRYETFLVLCKTLNYTEAGSLLCITQPAVTQHIHWLEEKYKCKLFEYKNRRLTLTEKGSMLYEFALSMSVNSMRITEQMKREEDKPHELKIGATKTIGEFEISESIKRYIKTTPNAKISLYVENTAVLLEKLERGEIDFAVVEGSFDKSKYWYRLLSRVDFFGICSPKSQLANSSVTPEKLLSQPIILREQGSGTRRIFEQLLEERSFRIEQYKNVTEISSFSVIKSLVKENLGISFVYEPVARKELEANELSFFTFEQQIQREFNFLSLKNSMFIDRIESFYECCKGMKKDIHA